MFLTEQTINNEIKSDVLKNVCLSLLETLTKIRTNEIDFRKGSVEIAAHKHIIQSIALDWLYSKNKNTTIPKELA